MIKAACPQGTGSNPALLVLLCAVLDHSRSCGGVLEWEGRILVHA